MSEAVKGNKTSTLTAFAGGDAKEAKDLKAAEPEANPANRVNPADVQKQSAHKQSVEEMELVLKQLEVEEKRLAVELAKANLVDTRERLDERALKRENVGERARANGEILRQNNANIKAYQDQCNHRKGGNELQGLMNGQGDSDQYAVWKHTFANNDTWVGCLRCHKKWKPPVKSDYADEAAFNAASAEYVRALNFPTQNKPSGAGRFQFSDNGEQYRKNTRNA